MKITWFGHAAFRLVTTSGIRIITDPYAPAEGLSYGKINADADVVVISHKHWDHSAIKEVSGSPVVITSLGKKEYQSVVFEGINSYHDSEKGRLRGENTIFKITDAGQTVIHIGDLGHIPEKNVLELLKNADVVLIPVGGVFTIGPKEARDIIRTIKPGIAVPMHYATSHCTFVNYTADDFANEFENTAVRRTGDTVTLEDFRADSGTTILIMESAR